MKSGVGSSGSPTQKASTFGLPRPSLYSSRIFDAVSARTAGRATMPEGRDSDFMNRVILDWSLVAAVGTMVAWGMNFAFVKYILEHLGVGAFMFLRFLVLPLLGVLLLVLI